MVICYNIRPHGAKSVNHIAWCRCHVCVSNSKWCQTMLDHDRWKWHRYHLSNWICGHSTMPWKTYRVCMSMFVAMLKICNSSETSFSIKLSRKSLHSIALMSDANFSLDFHTILTFSHRHSNVQCHRQCNYCMTFQNWVVNESQLSKVPTSNTFLLPFIFVNGWLWTENHVNHPAISLI